MDAGAEMAADRAGRGRQHRGGAVTATATARPPWRHRGAPRRAFCPHVTCRRCRRAGLRARGAAGLGLPSRFASLSTASACTAGGGLPFSALAGPFMPGLDRPG